MGPARKRSEQPERVGTRQHSPMSKRRRHRTITRSSSQRQVPRNLSEPNGDPSPKGQAKRPVTKYPEDGSRRQDASQKAFGRPDPRVVAARAEVGGGQSVRVFWDRRTTPSRQCKLPARKLS